MALFNKQDILSALQRLGQLAAEQGDQIELVLVGGAAMVLGFEARHSTHDVDAAILLPREARKGRQLATWVALERGWPEDWLNDAAKGYLVGLSDGGVVILHQELCQGKNSKPNTRSKTYGRPAMNKVEQLARAALQREGLTVRSLTQDLLRDTLSFQDLPRPTSEDAHLLPMAAGLIELLALRQNQQPPAWVKEIGPMPEPFFLLEMALHMKRLRELCESQSPEPLKKRKLYAPPNYLVFA